MKSLLFTLLILVFCISCGQEGISVVSQSKMTGINLPENSVLDQKPLDMAAARMLLELGSGDIKIGEVEVLGIVKSFTINHLKTELSNKGWQIRPVDNEYMWLKKADQMLLAYFSEGGQAMEFYIGKAKSSPAQNGNVTIQNQQQNQIVNNQIANPPKGKFHFDTTNFDDGWVAQDYGDKVIATKGAVKVYIYPPLQHDDVSRRAGRDYYWDNFISKQFQIQTKQYRDPSPSDPMKPNYIEGRAIDPATGKSCFLGFFVNSESGVMYPVLAVTPDENTFWAQFSQANNAYGSDLMAMRGYNKFAISLSDLVGTWTGGTSGAANYYNAYTGSYQGMAAAVKGDTFIFDSNGNYRSKHSGATGMVGNMNTYQQEYSGKASVTNWEITLPNRHGGKTTVYNAYFEVVSGGRILHLRDKQYTGMTYTLVKK